MDLLLLLHLQLQDHRVLLHYLDLQSLLKLVAVVMEVLEVRPKVVVVAAAVAIVNLVGKEIKEMVQINQHQLLSLHRF